VITALVLGAGLGVGLWALAVWLFPPRPALGAVLARSTTPPAPPPILATEDTGWAARLGRPFIAPLRALGLPGERLTRDLAVIGRPVATRRSCAPGSATPSRRTWTWCGSPWLGAPGWTAR